MAESIPRTQSSSAHALNELLFSRRGSVHTADEVRKDLCEAFQKVDVDSNGSISRAELTELVQGLHIPLKDLNMDIDALSEFMDPGHSNTIDMKEFSKCFEPFVREHEVKGIEMEIDEIMKDAISNVLCSARTERNHVNAGFLQASQRIEKDHQGFGVNFWGSSWRFRLYDDLYGAPKTSNGGVLQFSKRYANLKARLAGVAKGTDPWIAVATTTDVKVKNEIRNAAGVQLFCEDWLANIEREERESPKKDKTG